MWGLVFSCPSMKMDFRCWKPCSNLRMVNFCFLYVRSVDWDGERRSNKMVGARRKMDGEKGKKYGVGSP